MGMVKWCTRDTSCDIVANDIGAYNFVTNDISTYDDPDKEPDQGTYDGSDKEPDQGTYDGSDKEPDQGTYDDSDQEPDHPPMY
eukprot:gene56667-biopygen60520